MPTDSQIPPYQARWLEASPGRGLQSYFTSGTSPFPPSVRYIVYAIKCTNAGASPSFSCTSVIRLKPGDLVENAYGNITGGLSSIFQYTPAAGLTIAPVTIPTDSFNYWYIILDPNSTEGTITGGYMVDNPNRPYAYIIKAYDSQQITNPAAMTGCVDQVVVYGSVFSSYTPTFLDTDVYVNWNADLQGNPINTYVETLTLPVRYFNGVLKLPT
jgi:hypothetical protein